MPIQKSVFSIDVNDLDKLNKAFAKYHEIINKAPSAWSSISGNNKKIEEGFKGVVASLAVQNELMKKEEVSASNLRRVSMETSRFWTSIKDDATGMFNAVRGTVGVAASFGRAMRHDLILGIAGVGGALWGLDRLGAAAGAGRRSSTGLGLDYGSMSAFGLTYGRVLDPSTFLGGISNARGNVGSPEASALFALGLNPTQGGDTGTLSRQALRKIWELARGTPESLLGPVLHEGMGLGSLTSLEDLRRLKGMSPGEFDKYSSQMTKRTNQLGVDDNTLRKWQDFVNTLDTTGKRIEASLIRGLVRAAPLLERLSDGAATLVERFVGSKSFDSVLTKVIDTLEGFGNYLTSDKFKNTMVDLWDGLHGMGSFLKRWFGSGSAPGSPGAPQSSPMQGPNGTQDTQLNRNRFGNQMDWYRRHGQQAPITDYNQWLKSGGQGLQIPTTGIASQAGAAASALRLPGTSSSMESLLAQVAGLERSGDSSVSPAGAIGKYQIWPPTAARYGVTAEQLKDPAVNKRVAEQHLEMLSKRYKGNTAEILAAYNGGEQIGDYLRDHGDRSIPSRRPSDGAAYNYNEVASYLARAGFKVTIDNPAGSTVSTQTEMLGGSYPGSVP